MKRHGLLAAAAAACVVIGCTSVVAPAPAGMRPQEAEPAAAPAKTGAQLWAEICHRCHNYRSPASLSDAQWDVAVHHMRIRANLTGAEQRAIVEFLKAGN